MRLVTSIEDLAVQRDAARARGERIGLVPTRGDLHAGHVALLRRARAQCDTVVCSVHPSPRATSGGRRDDERRAGDAGVDLLWRHAEPGPGHGIRIQPRSAPHLADLALQTVRELSILRPDVAYVGDRHFSHARLLVELVADLLLPVEVRIVPTPHAPDGVPVGIASERLTGEQRAAARAVPETLDAVAAAAAAGEASLFRLRARAEGLLALVPHLDVSDVATVHPETFEPVDRLDQTHPALLVIEATAGGIPLADARLLQPPMRKEPPEVVS